MRPGGLVIIGRMQLRYFGARLGRVMAGALLCGLWALAAQAYDTPPEVWPAPAASAVINAARVPGRVAGRAPAGPPALPFDALPAAGRLERSQIGVVINDDDPYSVAVGAHYIRRRGLKPHQVLHVRLPVRPVLAEPELEPLRHQIEAYFGPQIQALALAWREPWAVECNSITSAVSLGFQAAQCQRLCGPGRLSPYFNEATAMPFSLLGVRPSMLLAASDIARAKALIDRGVASDGALRRRGGPAVSAVFNRSGDKARDVRAASFPPAGRAGTLSVRQEQGLGKPRPAGERLLLFQTGAVRVEGLSAWRFAPGAVADHLTSFGGVLDGSAGQMPATAWIDAGATASHGTVSEPCNYPQKFPHPQVLLHRLIEGGTLLEAYWKSVAWPTQSLFIGEPLAAPYAEPARRR